MTLLSASVGYTVAVPQIAGAAEAYGKCVWAGNGLGTQRRDGTCENVNGQMFDCHEEFVPNEFTGGTISKTCDPLNSDEINRDTCEGRGDGYPEFNLLAANNSFTCELPETGQVVECQSEDSPAVNGKIRVSVGLCFNIESDDTLKTPGPDDQDYYKFQCSDELAVETETLDGFVPLVTWTRQLMCSGPDGVAHYCSKSSRVSVADLADQPLRCGNTRVPSDKLIIRESCSVKLETPEATLFADNSVFCKFGNGYYQCLESDGWTNECGRVNENGRKLYDEETFAAWMSDFNTTNIVAPDHNDSEYCGMPAMAIDTTSEETNQLPDDPEFQAALNEFLEVFISPDFDYKAELQAGQNLGPRALSLEVSCLRYVVVVAGMSVAIFNLIGAIHGETTAEKVLSGGVSVAVMLAAGADWQDNAHSFGRNFVSQTYLQAMLRASRARTLAMVQTVVLELTTIFENERARVNQQLAIVQSDTAALNARVSALEEARVTITRDSTYAEALRQEAENHFWDLHDGRAYP